MSNEFEEALVTALESLQCIEKENNPTKKLRAALNISLAYEKTG